MSGEVLGHEAQERFFLRSLAAGRLVHAYLLHGEEGLGKGFFARRLARTVLCQGLSREKGPDSTLELGAAPGGEGAHSFGGCGFCRGCVQVDAGTHPDLWVTGAEGGSVRREQAEELVRFLSLRPVAGRRRVALVSGADALTPEAAAALLKTLEEPPGHGLVVLVAASAEAVPVTLRSRCQAVSFRPVGLDRLAGFLEARLGLPREEAMRLATLAGGRPGVALRMAGDEGWRRLWEDVAGLIREAEAAAREGPGRVPALAAGIGRLLAEKGAEGELALDVLALQLRERLARQLCPRDAAGGGGLAPPRARQHAALAAALAAAVEARHDVASRVNRRLVADVLALRLARAYAFEVGES